MARACLMEFSAMVSMCGNPIWELLTALDLTFTSHLQLTLWYSSSLHSDYSTPTQSTDFWLVNWTDERIKLFYFAAPIFTCWALKNITGCCIADVNYLTNYVIYDSDLKNEIICYLVMLSHLHEFLAVIFAKFPPAKLFAFSIFHSSSKFWSNYSVTQIIMG